MAGDQVSGFFFDEASVQKIAEAIRKLNSYDAEAYEPPEQDYGAMVDNTRKILKGTFSGSWSKNTTKTVTSIADNGDTFTTDAENLFATVGSLGTTSNCVLAYVGVEWLLIAAECSDN